MRVPQVASLADAGGNAGLVSQGVVGVGGACGTQMVAMLWFVVAGLALPADQIQGPMLRAGRAHLATGVAVEALVAGVAGAVGAECGALGGGREVGTSVTGGVAQAALVCARLASRATPPVGACVSYVALAGIYIATGKRGRAVVRALLTHIRRVHVLVCQTEDTHLIL